MTTDAPSPVTGARIGIIMDGNGRWAQQRGLSVTDGHRAGGKALRRTVEAALELNVAEMTVYAFSTENWERPADEVAGIMELFGDLLDSETPDLHDQGVCMQFVGRHDLVSDTLQSKMRWARDLTLANTAMTLVIAFNYGGRAELVDAVQSLIDKGVKSVDEEVIAQALYLPERIDPDLVIRTAGEQRLSNFLVWQTVYSELVFTETLWPDFGYSDLRSALVELGSRERRFGGRTNVGAVR